MPPQWYGTPSWRFAKATTRWVSRAGRRFGAGGAAYRAWAAGENRQASTTAISGRHTGPTSAGRRPANRAIGVPQLRGCRARPLVLTRIIPLGRDARGPNPQG